MYTDGVIDQVGGVKRRAFGRKRMIEVLKQINRMPLKDQQGMICRTLADYQGSEKRRDDVAIIGFTPIG